MSEAKTIVVACPACNDTLLIEQLNCGIFRHGVNSATMRPIDPHSSKEQVVQMMREGKLIGCGAAFCVVNGIPKICSYDLMNSNQFPPPS